MEQPNVANDEALIRTLKDEEERGWCTGDVELILSCYAPDFVSYHAHDSGDARTWTILDPHIEAFHSRLKGINLPGREWSADHREHVFEHLQIRGNSALAVIRQVPPGHPSWRTLWIFKKTDEDWKIASFIARIGGERLSPVHRELPKGLLLTAGGLLLGVGLGYYLGKRSGGS